MRDLGLEPILDPLHHVSFPDWLEHGFANPMFPELYLRFIENVAQRYEWAERYTVVNEPLPTLVLCALTGDWYPYRRSDADFVPMAVNVARAICIAGAKLRQMNPCVQLFHIDSCEHHRALDKRSQRWVEHANDRRFMFHDLTLGRVHAAHPMLPYLRNNGFTEDQRYWFQDHPAQIDVLGLDYYAHSEIDWRWNAAAKNAEISFPCQRPRAFSEVARDYVERYRLPVLLSETNVGGSVTDRITWLKFMEEQAEKLATFADFRGFCWFPSIDATDWDSLCTEANGCLSPMGIWGLDEDCESRYCSELSDWYVCLAKGKARSCDLPAYQFTPPLDLDLGGYLPLMSHWSDWRDPSESEAEREGRAA
jgi:beta-glucosidase/6-phospho-beta-glucosidase/beta-galactosidase